MSDTNEAVFVLPDGTPLLTGCKQPAELRFAAAPAWDEANDVLPQDQWEEHDDLKDFCSPVRAQKNNNCTNAALSGLAEALFRSAGVENVPRLSWSFLYALCNGGSDDGAMCRDLARKFRDGPGIPPESVWPDSRIFEPRGGMPAEAISAATPFQALEIYQCLNWQHVGSALTRRFLVYHGFVMGRDYQNTGQDGKVPRWDGRNAAGHAMFSRGLTRRFGDWRTITPNSWGTSWGDGGVGYWDASYFWDRRGNRVNLDAFAVRAIKRTDALPQSS